MRTEYKANNFRGITMGAEAAESHNPLPGEQAVPGLILDEAPFFFIVDVQRFPDRLPIVGVKEGQDGETLRYGGS